MSSNTSYFAEGQTGGGREDRYFATLNKTGAGPWRPVWSLGAVAADGEFGFNFGLSLALTPGISMRVAWEDDPLPVDGQAQGNRLFSIRITADLAWAQGRVVPARRQGVRFDRGALAGRVTIEGGLDFPGSSLSGLPIRLNGRIRTSTTNGGSFFVGGVLPGVYEVDLDSENLPIELAPTRTTIAVEVAAGAVTQVDFPVIPEFGIAGRLTDRDGHPVPLIRLELLNASGKILDTATTDRFGLYRIDRLRIGSYTLRVASEAGEDVDDRRPERPIEITDGFLFGQDLVLLETVD